MKKVFFSLLAFSAISLLSCGGGSSSKKADSEETTKTAPAPKVEMVPLDLSSVGINATINAPAGAVAKDNSYDVSVTAGDGFAIEISTSTEKIADVKKFVEENDVNKFVKYIADEPSGILYQSKVINDEYHFNYFTTIGENTYQTIDKRGGIFTQEQVQQMFDAAKSFKSK